MDIFYIHPSNIVRTVAVLEKQGMITRSPNNKDKRTWKLYPTDRALAVLEEFRTVCERTESLLLQGIDETEKELFIDLLMRAGKNFQTICFEKSSFRLSVKETLKTCSMGISSSLNQIAITFVQIILYNSLTYYGAQSVYGSDIPLAACGIVMKTNAIILAIVVGISQGVQPIIGFNCGAKIHAHISFYGAGKRRTVALLQLFHRHRKSHERSLTGIDKAGFLPDSSYPDPAPSF